GEGGDCRRREVPPQDGHRGTHDAHLLDDGNAGGTLDKVRSRSSVRRHRGEEQVQATGRHRRS
ncbi:unnamed protein product, partial [Ectocarpus sp. 4 AP-2014]